MAEITTAPNNVSVKFKGKPMAKNAKPSGSAVATPTSSKDENDWEAQDALRTMQRAQEHQDDPALMKRVATHAQKQADGLDTIMAKLPGLQKRGLVSDTQAAQITNRRTAARK